MDLVINKHLRRIAGRKAMVLFTDGVDTTSRRATCESTVREAEELDALIYPVAYATYGDAGWPPQFPLPGGRGTIILGLPLPRLPIPGTGGGGRGGGGSGGVGAGSTRGDYMRADA